MNDRKPSRRSVWARLGMTSENAQAIRAAHFREAAELLRTYPEYRGVMGIAATVVEQHADTPHVYLSVECASDDHHWCHLGSEGNHGQCKACSAPCACPCHYGGLTFKDAARNLQENMERITEADQ